MPASPGALRFNSDSNKLELYDGNQWTEIVASSPDSQTGGARGVFGGGGAPTAVNTIDYANITSTGNAIDFGDLLFTSFINGSCSSATRGLWAGGRPSNNTINFITISSTGNATDFGDTTDPREGAGGMGNSTRGIFSGGGDQPSPGSYDNVMDYITFASTGNANDFGDLTQGRDFPAACSSSTRGVIIGGYIAPGAGVAARSNVMDFVTISTLGNAADFGDMTSPGQVPGACSNSIRGAFNLSLTSPGGVDVNNIDYITIATLGNSQDFGDLTETKYGAAACSSSTRGLIAGNYTSLSNVINYFTIMSTGNAVDFGDLTQARGHFSACSNGHGGL